MNGAETGKSLCILNMGFDISKVSNSIANTFDTYLFKKGYWIYVLVAVAIIFLLGMASRNARLPFG